MPATPERQLAGFIAKFTPQVATQAHAILAHMRKRLRGACELVYDNYNALAIAFGPTDRVSDIVFSIALYPRWVSLFFAHGTRLADPDRVLKGAGSKVRHIVLEGPQTLDSAPVRALMKAALSLAGQPLGKAPGRIIIKSVSARQRPRRPAEPGPKSGSRRSAR